MHDKEWKYFFLSTLHTNGLCIQPPCLRKLDKSKLMDLIARPQINEVSDESPENCFVVLDGEFPPPTFVWPTNASTYLELYEEHVICQTTLWQQSGCCV